VRPTRKADNLIIIYESIVLKMWKPRNLTKLWASMVCYGGNFTFTTTEITIEPIYTKDRPFILFASAFYSILPT
jgi:hypothetical protein